jgi:hypothetical protein
MGQGLETDIIRNFTDPQVRIKQQGFGFLDPHSTEILCECQAGGFLENFAKVKRTNVHRLRYTFEIEGIGLVSIDIRSGGKN